MFNKPSEPKPGSSDRTQPPGVNKPPAVSAMTSTTSAPVASSSTSTSSTTSPQQVMPAAAAFTTTAGNTTTTSISANSRLDEQQQSNSKLSYSVNKQQIAATALHQHYLNYFNSNIPKEEAKSQPTNHHQHRARGSIFNSLSQHSSSRQLPQQQLQQQQQQVIFLNQDIHQAPHHAEHPPPLAYPHQRTNHLHQQQQHYHNHNHNAAQIYHIPSSNHHHPPSNNNLHLNNYQQQHHYASPITYANNLSRSVPQDDTFLSHKMPHHHQQQQQQPIQMNPSLNHRTYSTGAISSSQHQQQNQPFMSGNLNQNLKHHVSPKVLTRSTRQGQLDKDSEDKAATVKAELENDLEGYKNSELEAISSLERNLPIELSFLIRQQAHCMARMNYLDRQLRELRENGLHLQQQQVDTNQVSSTSIMNAKYGPHNNIAAAATTATLPHSKNGNFILSDDSGGEYSRATISDDDELSSLLDQIAKSVRPDQQQQQQRPLSNTDAMLSSQIHNMQQQQQQRLITNYSTVINNQQQQQPHHHHLQPHHHQQQQPQSYAIMNPNQLHHQQAVPIFVMSSPIAVAHPSSISSNILPGVHFQPEPRYNQYYEDFYNQSSQALVGQAPHSTIITQPSAPAMQGRGFGTGSSGGFRSQQFDTSMSAVEQLVSQKEKRQIISQLKSADNWLKMRAAGGATAIHDQGSSSSTIKSDGKRASVGSLSQSDGLSNGGPQGTGIASDDMRATSSSTLKQDNDRVIDENDAGE